MRVLLRVVLTVLLVVLGLELGIRLSPSLARFGALGARATPLSQVQPDWGGGRLTFPAGPGARSVVRPGCGTQSEIPRGFWSRPRDYALTLAFSAPGQTGRTARFELPSSDNFRKQLLPGSGDAEPPAADIPLYPQSSCRMQVGQGTVCFTGFYLTPDSIEAVRAFYVRVLGQLGWQRVTAGRAGLLETFAKRDEDRTVLVQLRKQDSVTTRIGLVAMTPGSPDRNERK